MNLEMTVSRNARTCRSIKDNSTRERNFSLGGSSIPYCSPLRSSRLESAPTRISQRETAPASESKKTSTARYMREVLCGMGGKRGEVATYETSTLHALMALRDSGREDLVRMALAASANGLEWRISIRTAENPA